MKKILPINLNPKIASECWTYVRSAIISAYPNLDSWYINHLDNLYINDYFEVNYGEHGEKYKVLQHYESVLNTYTKNIHDLNNKNIINYIIEQINDNKYIMIDVDLSKIEKNTLNNTFVQLLIYGYDKEEEILYSKYLPNNTIEKYKFEDFVEAFSVRKAFVYSELKKNIFNKQNLYPITLFEVRNDYNETPNLNLFLNNLKKYLNRIHYEEHDENISFSFRDGICSIYDGFLEILIKIKNGTFDVLNMLHSFAYNFRKLIEFHNTVKWRLKYLDNLYTINIDDNIYSEFDWIIENLEICKNLASKYLETKNNDLIDKIFNYLIDIIPKEKNIITKLIEKISKNILCESKFFVCTQYENLINNNTQKIIKCPILLYHHFLDEEIDNMDSRTTGKKFEENIKVLIEKGYKSISLEDLKCFENREKKLPEKPFIITIDDGYLSNYEIAFPILKKYNVFADIFVVTDFIGLNNHPDYPMLIPHFNNEQAKEMEESGLIKIHSHGKWHKPNNEMNDDKFLINIEESMQVINAIKKCKKFISYAYPEEKFNGNKLDLVKKQGYCYQLINKYDLTIENINKGCLGRILINYKSDICSIIQDYNYYINKFIKESYRSENLILNNDILIKCKNLKIVLDECQYKYKNKFDYNLKSIKYDGFDIPCKENELIIYSNKLTTETQSSNYEIIIDKNRIIGFNENGNSVIPKGGYVLSGNIGKILKYMYIPNADVFIYESENKIIILETPETRIQNCILSFKNIKSNFKNIKKDNFTSFEIQSKIDETQILINECKDALESIEYETAVQLSERINNQIENIKDMIQYMFIPNKSIENRAVWYRSKEKNDDDVRKIIEKASSLNINTILLETWYYGKFIGYSDNPLIEHQKWFNDDFDVLEAFCRIGHEYNIEIHAWVENFFIGVLEPNKDNLIKKMEGKYLLDKNNNNYNQTAYGKYVFLNPYDNYCKNFILDLYSEILTKYDVDGIHLDYMRFPDFNYGKFDYGYNEDIIKGFKNKYNTSVDVRSLNEDDEMYKKWCKFREDIINNFVEEVYDLIKAINPNIWISCACYPNIDIAQKTIFQNLSEWVKNGWIDEVFSMSYYDNSYSVEKNAESFIRICKDKVFYSIGLNAFEEIPDSELLRQIEVARRANTDGIALFALNYISEDNYTNVLKRGAFRQKSVNVYKIDKLIITSINSVLTMYLNLSDTNCLQDIRKRCLTLINKMEELDFSRLNNNEKITYAQDCINDVKAIIETTNACTINEILKTSLKENFLMLLNLLNINKNRLILKNEN